MRRSYFFPAWAAIAALTVTPAQAQFGGILRKVATPTPTPSPSPDSSEDNGGCPKGKKGSRAGRNILGGILNEALGDAASKAGVYSYVPIAEVSDTLTNAIACKLDPAEQVQAAKATEDAVRGEAVGSTANWTSETREGVSGSSTVIARNDEAGGRQCINVTDFIIVDGEETRATKRMCREPGQPRYTLAQA